MLSCTFFLEFLNFIKIQEEARMLWLNSVHEAQRLQKQLDASLSNVAELERKLVYARRLLEQEANKRKESEAERLAIVRYMVMSFYVVGQCHWNFFHSFILGEEMFSYSRYSNS